MTALVVRDLQATGGKPRRDTLLAVMTAADVLASFRPHGHSYGSRGHGDPSLISRVSLDTLRLAYTRMRCSCSQVLQRSWTRSLPRHAPQRWAQTNEGAIS